MTVDSLLQVYEIIDDSAMASKHDVPSAKVIYDELKQRFPRHKRTKQEDGE
ncbi:MAG: hypothetical protein LBP63_02755 [Prevotellaceae bacterium]|nr:hypothetical protein [Prevotellaceae bacterium]